MIQNCDGHAIAYGCQVTTLPYYINWYLLESLKPLHSDEASFAINAEEGLPVTVGKTMQSLDEFSYSI